VLCTGHGGPSIEIWRVDLKGSLYFVATATFLLAIELSQRVMARGMSPHAWSVSEPETLAILGVSLFLCARGARQKTPGASESPSSASPPTPAGTAAE
jgi:hypothetical protein